MRPCPVCGFRNADNEDFCANCGTYLGWSQEPSREAVPTAEADSEPADPDRVDPERADSDRAEPKRADPGRAEPDRADSGRAGQEEAPAPLAPPALGPVAPTLPAPGEGDRTQPGAVQPAKPVPKRPVVRPAADSTQRHGVPCPVCGTPNPPERQLCQHCAAPLRTPATQGRPPWWSTKRRTQRYGSSGRWLRRGAALIALVAVVIVGIMLLPAGRNLFENVRDKLGSTAAVAPTTITANAQQPGHPATALSDGLTNRYWGAPAVGDSAKFTFRAPFRLVDVIIHTGASMAPDEFQQQARAVQLDLVTTDSTGESQTQPVTLNDRPGAQTVQTGISDVVTVRLVIRSAAGLAPGRDIALGEVEFFKRN